MLQTGGFIACIITNEFIHYVPYPHHHHCYDPLILMPLLVHTLGYTPAVFNPTISSYFTSLLPFPLDYGRRIVSNPSSFATLYLTRASYHRHQPDVARESLDCLLS